MDMIIVKRKTHTCVNWLAMFLNASRWKKRGLILQRSSRPRKKGVVAATPVRDSRPLGCRYTFSKALARK